MQLLAPTRSWRPVLVLPACRQLPVPARRLPLVLPLVQVWLLLQAWRRPF